MSDESWYGVPEMREEIGTLGMMTTIHVRVPALIDGRDMGWGYETSYWAPTPRLARWRAKRGVQRLRAGKDFVFP